MKTTGGTQLFLQNADLECVAGLLAPFAAQTMPQPGDN